MNTLIGQRGSNQANLVATNQTNKQPLNPNTNAINDANTKSKAQQQQPPNKPTKLKKVGEYIFIKQIGCGAYSTVHQGKHKSTHNKVAIKMIPNGKLNDVVYNRVISEIKILTSLNHRNIVKIIDFKKTTQNYYLIFEYCQNGDLESYIKKHYEGKLSECLCQQVMFQVRDAFKQLTHHKIVHRDLKLANILVDEQFTIKIADFGFAKHNQDDDLLKSTLGTPITMAPEILYGKQYNEKCDIWSLGVIIYQMIFGKPPFMPAKGGGIAGLIKEIQKEIFIFPDDIPVSEELKNLLRRMLTVNPQKRIDFKELFTNKWITGEYKPGQKDMSGTNQDIDLTQSLKQKKELAKEKYGNSKISYSKIQQHPAQIPEHDENAEEEQKDNGQDNYDQQDEDGQEKDIEDIDIQTTQETNAFLETPTPQGGDTLLQTQDNQHHPTANTEAKQLLDQKQGVLVAAVMKLALSLRKYYEKRIIIFIANCNKYIDFYDRAEKSMSYHRNHFYRYSVFLSAIIISSRISDFVKGLIKIKIDSETFELGTYSVFSGIFLDKGENDEQNYTHILRKKQATFNSIVQKLQKSAQMNLSTTNSPEYLFFQNLIKTYSFHKTTSKSEDEQLIVKEMAELFEIYEKLQLPYLQLHSIIRKQGVDIKKLFSELKNMFEIISETVKNNKKYVRYQTTPFEIKIGVVEIPENEQQFNEIQKKLQQLFSVYHENSTVNSLSSINTDNNF